MGKKFGFWSIVLLTINSIIGSGIFLTPASVVKQVGSFTPLVYIIAASLAGVLALSFASAAKYVKGGGGAYAYTKAAFGEKTGFYVGVTRFIAAAIAWGVMATFVVKTILQISNQDSESFTLITIGFVILMLILLFLNLFGNKIVEIFSNISTIGKIGALLAAILTGLYLVVFHGINNFEQINNVVDTNEMNLSLLITGIITAIYAFTGFENASNATSEMKNPEKVLPKAIPLGMLIVGIINISVVTMAMFINPIELVNTKEVVGLAAVFTNPIIKSIVLYGSLVSMFGINLVNSFGVPRILEAMAVDNQLSPIFAKKNKQGVPLLAFLTTTIIALIIPMSFAYATTDIMLISSIARFLQFLLVPIAVIMFFYGKNKESVLKAKKNILTDVFVPTIAIFATALLLIKFDWIGQFSIVEGDLIIPNYLAMSLMLIGFIILPVILYYLNKKRINNKN